MSQQKSHKQQSPRLDDNNKRFFKKQTCKLAIEVRNRWDLSLSSKSVNLFTANKMERTKRIFRDGFKSRELFNGWNEVDGIGALVKEKPRK